MDFWLLLSTIGAVASIAGVALPLQTRHQRILHVVYGLAIACFASMAVWYWQQNQRMKKVERAATVLLSDEAGDESHISKYSDEGFIQASLAFLEKNRDLYPDSYSRAQDLCKLNHCLDATYGDKSREPLDHAYNQIKVASALKGLIRGISTLEGGS
jgi:hypothetical protein